MINYNENENKKINNIDQGIKLNENTDTNILNVETVSVWLCLYVLSNI